jgi:hypothetical protein
VGHPALSSLTPAKPCRPPHRCVLETQRFATPASVLPPAPGRSPMVAPMESSVVLLVDIPLHNLHRGGPELSQNAGGTHWQIVRSRKRGVGFEMPNWLDWLVTLPTAQKGKLCSPANAVAGLTPSALRQEAKNRPNLPEARPSSFSSGSPTTKDRSLDPLRRGRPRVLPLQSAAVLAPNNTSVHASPQDMARLTVYIAKLADAGKCVEDPAWSRAATSRREFPPLSRTRLAHHLDRANTVPAFETDCRLIQVLRQ